MKEQMRGVSPLLDKETIDRIAAAARLTPADQHIAAQIARELAKNEDYLAKTYLVFLDAWEQLTKMFENTPAFMEELEKEVQAHKEAYKKDFSKAEEQIKEQPEETQKKYWQEDRIASILYTIVAYRIMAQKMGDEIQNIAAGLDLSNPLTVEHLNIIQFQITRDLLAREKAVWEFFKEEYSELMERVEEKAKKLKEKGASPLIVPDSPDLILHEDVQEEENKLILPESVETQTENKEEESGPKAAETEVNPNGEN